LVGLAGAAGTLVSAISEFDGPMIEYGDVGGGITGGDHWRRLDVELACESTMAITTMDRNAASC
jgi:hypothetical protein